MKIEDFALWDDRVAVLSCGDGERTTAHILTVDTKCNKLIVDVLDSNRPYEGKYYRSFAISPDHVSSIGSVTVCGDADRFAPWAETCQMGKHLSPERFVLFAICIVAMLLFAFIAVVFSDVPGVAQLTGAISYSTAVVLYTFRTDQGMFRGNAPIYRPFYFSCPFVQRQLSWLVLRHMWFILALVLFLTVGLLFAPYLPAAWLNTKGRGAHPIFWTLLCPSMLLVFIESYLNRLLLLRAHPEISSLDEQKDTGCRKSSF